MSNFGELLQRDEKGFFLRLVLPFLFLCSLLYQAVIEMRNMAYRLSILPTYKSSAFVISIGNIVAGGTGKTPFTSLLAERLLKQIPLAILSRGYGSKASHEKKSILLSEGNGPKFSADYCGDEPYLLSYKHPKALFIIGKDRIASAKMAEAMGVKCLLLDDGMQHRRLHRDLNIVVMDAGDPFGGGYLLPRGMLREPLKELKRADCIVLNHADGFTEELEKKLRTFTSAPLIYTRVVKDRIYDLRTKEELSIKGKKIAAFCGISKPSYFFQSLEKEGAEIILTKSFPDHASFSERALSPFFREALQRGAEMLLCTEKDATKLHTMESPIPIVVFTVFLEIFRGQEILDKILVIS